MNVVETDETPLSGDHCTDLVAQIEASSWSNLLSENTSDQLSTYALADLNAYVEMYTDLPAGPEMSLDRLDSIVADLPSEEVVHLSLADRFWNWLKDLIAAEVDDGRLAWLKELNISPAASRIGLYVLGAIIVLSAAAIVLNEIRMARSGRRRKSVFRNLTQPINRSESVRLQDVPLLDRPAILLTTVIDYLGYIPLSFTHRQLLLGISTLSPQQLKSLETLTLAAERIRFGAWQPDEQTINGIVLDGMGLVEQLEGQKSQ
ncbi:MAG: hypothetical protein O3A63_18070 [Proteobacteria bacterium]|nr:hypothetical protein [Pseudomonadota bacterium]